MPVRPPYGIRVYQQRQKRRQRRERSGGFAPGFIVFAPARRPVVERLPFYRYSYGLSFGYGGTYAIHGEYYGGLIQAWSFDRKSLIDAGSRLEAELKQHILDWLVEQFGSSVDVGFLPLNDGAGVQEVDYSANLDERVKWRVEDSEGGAVDSGEDSL